MQIRMRDPEFLPRIQDRGWKNLDRGFATFECPAAHSTCERGANVVTVRGFNPTVVPIFQHCTLMDGW